MIGSLTPQDLRKYCTEPGLCGSWLASDGITAVQLIHRIAGKPDSHKF